MLQEVVHGEEEMHKLWVTLAGNFMQCTGEQAHIGQGNVVGEKVAGEE